MQIKIEKNDRFFSTVKMMGGATMVDSLSFDGLFPHELRSESLYDVRGNQIPNVQNIVNSEGDSLATMGRIFSLLQPSAFLEMVQDSLVGVPHQIAFAASFGNERSFILGVEIAGLSNFEIGGEGFKQFQVYGYGVDGTLARYTSPLLHRLFCANQFSMIIARAEGKAKNTENGGEKYGRIINEIDKLAAVQRGFMVACERLANISLAYDDARRFVAGLLATGSKLSKQGQTLVESVLSRYQRGIENHGVTRYDMFNGITEHYTHDASKKTAGVFGAGVIGKAAEIKRNAFKALTDETLFNATVGKGRVILDATVL